MKTFFTADLHLFHKNIIKYCKRPFENLDEMHETIKQNWNMVVSPIDHVYIVGDVAFSNGVEDKVVTYLKNLNGKKFLIRGNHDKKLDSRILAEFQWVKDYYKLKVSTPYEDQEIVLLHYAMKVWDKSHHGSWHLYGHSHGSLKDDPNALSMDIGVDANNFIPLSFEQVSEILKRKKFVAVDHHT